MLSMRTRRAMERLSRVLTSMPKKRWLRCGGKGEVSTRAGGVLQQAVVWACLRAPHKLYPERCNASSEIEKGDRLWDGANTAQFVGCHLCYASNQLQRCLIWGSLATHRQALRDTTQHTPCVSVAIPSLLAARNIMCVVVVVVAYQCWPNLVVQHSFQGVASWRCTCNKASKDANRSVAPQGSLGLGSATGRWAHCLLHQRLHCNAQVRVTPLA